MDRSYWVDGKEGRVGVVDPVGCELVEVVVEGAAEHLANGWSQQYWQPLDDHLAG